MTNQYLTSLGLAVRPATKDDLKFIESSWTSNFKDSFRSGLGTGPFDDQTTFFTSRRILHQTAATAAIRDKAAKEFDAVYYREMKHLVQAIISTIQPLVVYDPDNPTVIIGWACGTSTTLYYVYIKLAFRQKRIASSLITSICTQKPDCIFQTFPGSKLIESIYGI